MKNKLIKKPGVFLDRDGVINYDYGYVHKIKDFKIRKGVIKGLRFLTKKGYLLFIITNQSGIAKGIFTEKEYKIFTKKIKKIFKKKGVFFKQIYYCPYHPKATIKKYRKITNLRKPGNLMIENIRKKWKINIKTSFMIGDKKTDQLAAKKSKIYFEYPKKNFSDQVKKILRMVI